MPDTPFNNDDDAGTGPDPFDALLQSGWAGSAGPAELSAEQRKVAAQQQAKAFKSDGRRARRQARLRKLRSSTRPYAIPAIFALIIGAALVWQFRPTSSTVTINLPGVQQIRTIRVIQILPSDAAKSTPADETLVRKIASDMREWFRTETNGTVPRIKSKRGVIQVETVRLSIDSSLLETEAAIARRLQDTLERQGVVLEPDQAFLAFVPIHPDDLCGEAAVRTAAIFLKSCNPRERDFQTRPEIVAAHELLHLLRAVPECAPHYRSGSHVSGAPDDIMYEPRSNEAVRARVQHLDPGRDDYFGHGRKNCLDIATLPIWVQASK